MGTEKGRIPLPGNPKSRFERPERTLAKVANKAERRQAHRARKAGAPDGDAPIGDARSEDVGGSVQSMGERPSEGERGRDRAFGG